MKTIQINMPDELEKSLSSVPGNRNVFIVEVIEKRLKEMKDRQNTEKLLVEGYKVQGSESEQLSKEFNKVDLENWDEY